jgi:uncharacterized protein (DUF1501 family)
MTITRRQFLKRSGVAAGAGLVAPGLLANPFVRMALAETLGDRYLVVLYLDGGNDGLNTVVPADNGLGGLRSDYMAARNAGLGEGGTAGGIRLSAADLSGTLIGNDPNTQAQLAFHPGFAGSGPGAGGIHALYTQQKVAVVQGCGYPQPSLSHLLSSVIWETADPHVGGDYGGTGWLGRYLADPSTMYGVLDIPVVAVASAVASEFRQSGTSVLAVNRLRDFGFPLDPEYPDDDAAKEQAFLILHAESLGSGQAEAALVGTAGTSAFDATHSFPQLHGLYQSDRSAFDQMYSDLGTSMARDLREVAKVIYGVVTGQPNVAARHFWVSNGGYDTHAEQGGAVGQHFNLHNEVSSAVKVFYDDCADMGLADKLCILVWSEFGRRVVQNSNGTDHGSQAPMFLIGGKINGGVYGNHPNIATGALADGNTIYSQAAGDPFRSTDFRDVYGTVLKHWLNMPEGVILPSVLELDTGFDPNTYWTEKNFDLLHPVNGQPLFLP